MNKLKIVIDSYIPYIQGILDELADVKYLPYKEITNENIKDADGLIIRTRTHCNEKLLAGTNVKFIASATIGYDHIDAEYCRKNYIEWTNAPGSNALSVVQYIASALSLLSKKNNFELKEKTIGIIGVGCVGSKVAQLAESFGMKLLLNDPPRKRSENLSNYVELEEICHQADIITFHTPLNMSGADNTFYLANEIFFNSLKKKPIIINAARGEIINTKALIKAIKADKVSETVIDCWENEPTVDKELVNLVILGTPHIAGYSADGKANASTQSVRAISRFFGLGKDNWEVKNLPEPNKINLSELKDIRDFFVSSYNIEADNRKLKCSYEEFEKIRSNYHFRREPKAYVNQLPEKLKKQFLDTLNVFI